MCYAVTSGPDPLGPYYRYEFRRKLFPDYPRPAIWPDGYYVPTSTGDDVIEKHACVVDREKMLAGRRCHGAMRHHPGRQFPEQCGHRRQRVAASRGSKHHDGGGRLAAQRSV